MKSIQCIKRPRIIVNKYNDYKYIQYCMQEVLFTSLSLRFKMKGLFVIALVITLAHAKVDVRELFSGKDVQIGPYNTHISVGNLTKKYDMDSDDVTASGNAVMLAHLLRRMFGVGIYPMPPLDPYNKKNLETIAIESNSFLSGNLNLMSSTVEKAKYFNLQNLEIRMKTGRIDFEVNFPSLHFVVDFQTDMLFSYLIPVIASGQLRAEFGNLTVTGALQAEPKQLDGFGNKLVYQLEGARVNIQSKNLTVAFVGMQLENDLIQSLDRAQDSPLFAKWMTKLKNILETSLLKGCLSQINNSLRSLSVAQVKAYLLPDDFVISY